MEANPRNKLGLARADARLNCVFVCLLFLRVRHQQLSRRVESWKEYVRGSDVALEDCSHTVVRDSPQTHLLCVRATTRGGGSQHREVWDTSGLLV